MNDNFPNHPNSSQRLRDLETILIWEGQIDNPRVRDILGVKPVWASRLIAELTVLTADIAYRETSHSPLRLRKDASLRGRKCSADNYLRVLLASQDVNTGLEDCRRDLSVIEPATFSMVAKAIRQGSGLRVAYRSMANPAGSQRIIYPHAIIRAPGRWHIRAWCDTRQAFRDFNFGRMTVIEAISQPAPASREADAAWNTFISVDVVAHPALTEPQRAMIADEYFPGASARKLKMRRSLIGYVIQDLNIATNPEKQLPPQFQLSVAHADNILPLFASTG